jgi:integrase/recombinase XerC/integrase/recombinase XerD
MRNYSSQTLTSYERVIKNFGKYVWLRKHKKNKLVFTKEDYSRARLDAQVDIPRVFVPDYLSSIASLHTYEATTLHRILSTLSSFYRFLKSQNAVTANPVLYIERPRIKEKHLVYLKHNQVLDLLASIKNPRDHLIIRIIYATGIRVSELCKMNIEDIDFEERIIRIRGKGGKIRLVFIDEETAEEIRFHIKDRKIGPLILGEDEKMHISQRSIQRIFNNHAPEGITPHKIRHSYASELYRRSKNLRVVQENLGHSSIRTTEIYLHTDLDERKKVYNEYFPLSDSNAADKAHRAPEV